MADVELVCADGLPLFVSLPRPVTFCSPGSRGKTYEGYVRVQNTLRPLL